MQHFVQFMGMIYNLFNLPINIYGFEFSLWQVFMFGLIVSIIFGFVGRMIHDD